ncbi:MAG TPA: ATP-dependent Clp protease adaptor ClpS [Byssovorax sp.]|jgi:ATP-dependent Clp protease adaptor protein ClpS
MPTRPDEQDGTLVVPKPQVKRDRVLERVRRYHIVFYNDAYTTKWFVVDVLMRFFYLTEASATAFMLVVHETGRGVVGSYTRDVAETKAAEVLEYAKEWGMPLRLDIEPEED